jgi:transposase
VFARLRQEFRLRAGGGEAKLNSNRRFNGPRVRLGQGSKPCAEPNLADSGNLISHSFSPLSYHQGLAQFCWAHLQRTLQGIGEGAATADTVHFARDMLSFIDGVFALRYRFRGEAASGERLLSRKELIEQSIPIQKKICVLAIRYLDSDDGEVRNLAQAFYEHWDKLFTFLAHGGVEPTNNFAERILRLFVLIRKITLGSRSATGEIALARLPTVTQTCKLQHRRPLIYLLTAVYNHRRGLPAPSVRPLQNQ